MRIDTITYLVHIKDHGIEEFHGFNAHYDKDSDTHYFYNSTGGWAVPASNLVSYNWELSGSQAE